MGDQSRFLEHLKFLYGEEAAQGVLPRLASLVEEFRGKIPRRAQQKGVSLNEKHALLITYGDQVRCAGEAPLQTLDRFAHDYIRGIICGIHILPHFPFTSDDGFSVTDYFAVNPELGGWKDVVKLARSFDLMFDAVFNHMSAQGEWFRKFLANDGEAKDFFITVEGNPDLSNVVRPRALPLLTEFESASGPRKVWTTFSADQVDLNFKNPEVLLGTLRALLFYVENGARFIRLDAIAYLWKEIGTACIHLPQTHRVIQLWREVLEEVSPGVMLITETNVPHQENISYFGNGRNEAHLVYNFALPPLVLHALLREDARHLTDWAAGLALPSSEVSFFNFTASHDGIGLNPARGILAPEEIDFLVERCQAHGGLINYKNNPDGTKSPYEMNIVYFDAINDPAGPHDLETQVRRFLLSQSIMVALRGMPGIYFHSLVGSRNDREAAERTGINRRINRRKFELDELKKELKEAGSLRQRVYGCYRQLMTARGSTSAFSPRSSQTILSMDARVFAIHRRDEASGERVLVLHNVSGEEVPVDVTAVAEREPFEAVLFGTGREQISLNETRIVMHPYETLWLGDQPVD